MRFIHPNISDVLLEKITECSKKLALSLKTKGLVNIQYLIYNSEVYVIEVNPRASRTVPYISKVTGVPMVDLATKVMQGEALKSLGFGTGLYKNSPYTAVKVPVFSFEKLTTVNSILGPEMKSTGEVLGIGKTLNEALFKGLLSAGFNLCNKTKGVYISVDLRDRYDLINLSKKFYDAGYKMYADEKCAKLIKSAGLDAEVVKKEDALSFIEKNLIDYIVYTNSGDPQDINSYILLHQRALQLSIACLTSLDTANALADILLSRFNEHNTELVDINNLREEKLKIKFVKMQGTSDDYIFIDNREKIITCPESLAIDLTNRHLGIGGDGLVLIENSLVADAKMRIFNADGSEGKMAGNSIRCVGKYLYDNKIVKNKKMTIETASGIKELSVYLYDSKVRTVCVNMGKAELSPKKIPANFDGDKIIGEKAKIDGKDYEITCVSMGNPHCVVFLDKVIDLNVKNVGPYFENYEKFPERINTEFVRIIDSKTLRMRVWERGNGETPACGTGACAAVVASVLNGYCLKDEDITVKVDGGELTVKYTDNAVYLTGNATMIYEGEIEY